MIINGGSRSNFRFFAKHLTRADENERVMVTEIRGLAADNVLDALREMDAVASGTRCKNHFYHANINPREGEELSPEQWEQAVDTLERNLGLEGHSRFVVQHEKNGRIHQHVVWSRIDPDTMTAVSDSFTARLHEQTSRELEAAFNLEPVESVLIRDRETERERGPKSWENFRGHDSGIDPREVKAEVTALWRESDNGAAFAAALEAHGYILARGDRRDFVIVDRAGDEHSLTRRIDGAKAAEVRARMADIDREALPSVDEARARAQEAARDAQQRQEREPTGAETPGTFIDQYAEEAARMLGDNDAEVPWSEEERAASAAPAADSDYIRGYSGPFEADLRSQGRIGERDGLSLWDRAVALYAHVRETVTTWVKERWQSWSDYVDNRRGEDDVGKAPDAEPEPPDDMGR